MMRTGMMIMVLFNFLHAGWLSSFFDPTPTPPLKMPIDLTKADNKVELEFRISDAWSYWFKLEFYYNNPKLDSFHDVSQVQKIVGYNSYDAATGEQTICESYEYAKRDLSRGKVSIDENYNLDGTVIPLNIEIYKIEKNKKTLYLQKSYMTKGKNGGGYDEDQKKHAISREFAHIHFDEGKYLVVIENPQGFPELKDRDIRFSIYRTRKYK